LRNKNQLIIEVKDLTKVYSGSKRDLAVFENLSLDIYKGETISIVGPSGCGKSTLLFLIAGLITKTSGEIIVRGKSISGAGSDRAVVFQSDAIFPWMTVQKNIIFGPKIRGKSKEEISKIASKYLKLVELEKYADFYPKQLSGGMKKRVDIARAYANNPSVLLMDEPFGSLDAFTKEKMQVALIKIASLEKSTILFITHDIEEAIFISDRVALMTRTPAKIRDILPIPFPKIRKPSLKLTPEFQDLRRKIKKKKKKMEGFGI